MMISSGKRKLLNYFYEHPFSEIHLRELSRSTLVGLDNCSKFLHYFISKNYLKLKKIDNKNFYKSNLNNLELLKIFEFIDVEQRQIFYSSNILVKNFVDSYVEYEFRNIFLILCFNGNTPYEYLFVFLKEIPKEKMNELKIKINAKCYFLVLNQFETYCKNNMEFFRKLLDKKIVLYGENNFWFNLNFKYNKKGIYVN